MFLLNKHRRRTSVLFSFGILLLLTSCLGDNNSTGSTPEANLIETAHSFDDLSTFSELADSTDLNSLLSDSQYYTLFAPVNEAFEQLDEEALDTLSHDQLSEILSYHVADSAIYTNEIHSELELQTIQGDSLYLANVVDGILINNGSLVAANYQATDGILHATNTVLFPDKYLDITKVIGKRTVLKQFILTIKNSAAELDSSLQEHSQEGYTVFSPTNSAITSAGFTDTDSALQDTLEYHVVPQQIRAEDFQSSQTLETLNGKEIHIQTDGNAITVNDSISVTQTNLEGTNGITHIIDQVLFPPSDK